jgi:predicted PurR-regulated permease PerM
MNDKAFLNKAIEAAIRIVIIAALAFWSFQIFQPFLRPVVWGVIIAIATYPIFAWLNDKLGGRSRLSATLFTLLALAILITPTVILSTSLIESAQALSAGLRQGSLSVPPPAQSVAGWPVIGERLYEIWSLASLNLEAALMQYRPQLQAFGAWLLSAGGGVGLGILQFVISILIAGVLHAHASGGYEVTRTILMRLAGERGAELTDLATATVRSVARGVLGVAFIQSLLAGIGMIAAGVPWAGLWALLVLIVAVIQLPPLLILLPIVFYVFSVDTTMVAVLFTIWSIFVSVSDSFLKPMLLGRGVAVPMLVILIGAIGGMILSGIIGLFVAPVIFALSYTLFMAWLYEDTTPPARKVKKDSSQSV